VDHGESDERARRNLMPDTILSIIQFGILLCVVLAVWPFIRAIALVLYEIIRDNLSDM
jgi:uncharacterized membrane protein